MMFQKFLIFVCLIALSLQLSSPVVTCVANCHSRIQSCHRSTLNEVGSQGCPHQKTASNPAVAAKPRCECAIQAHQPLSREETFTLRSSEAKLSKASDTPQKFAADTRVGLLQAHLHGPPAYEALTRQNTFLLNSNLRI